MLVSGISGHPTKLVEVPKDPSRTHPYRQKEVIDKVNSLLSSDYSINQHDIKCVVKVYGVKKRPDFFYQGAISGSPVQYSEHFVQWLVQQFNKNNNFFLNVRQKYREMQKDGGG